MAHKVRITNISDSDSEGVVVRTWVYGDRLSDDDNKNTALSRGGSMDIVLESVDSISIDDVVLQTQNEGTQATFTG